MYFWAHPCWVKRSSNRVLGVREQKCLATYLENVVSVAVGDITNQSVDVIVNAANSTLLGGGGVDGAIHARGGALILEECREIRRNRFPSGLPTGQAVLTTAGRLPARQIIHTVGPITRIGQQPDAAGLAACYRNCLSLAAENNLRSIAFPAIATGAFGYPREEAALVVSETIESTLSSPGLKVVVKDVRLIFYGAEDAHLFVRHQRFSR
jgi:O-acetyl-ADP-ribose deacetylase (regulator of RNase III)